MTVGGTCPAGHTACTIFPLTAPKYVLTIEPKLFAAFSLNYSIVTGLGSTSIVLKRQATTHDEETLTLNLSMDPNCRAMTWIEFNEMPKVLLASGTSTVSIIRYDIKTTF
jgi:hypothetical protein